MATKFNTLGEDQWKATQNNDPIDFTINGKCSNCGNCCSNRLAMTDNEIVRIRAYVDNNKIEAINHLPPGSILMTHPPIDMICPFLHEEKGCLIYFVRPNVCRDFLCNGEHQLKDSNLNLGDKTLGMCLMRETIWPRAAKRG